MMGRRLFTGLLGAALIAPAGAEAKGRGWVEVVGAAHVSGAADLPAARRRALADALLSASLAGGADLRGHSALSMTRMTSDLMVMRPTGQILEHRVLSEQLDGQLLRLRVAARVGQPRAGECPERRRLLVTAYAPVIDVAPDVPAWADALAGLLDRAACQPVLERLRLASGRLTLPVGRAQGPMRTSIGFTVDPDRSTELLEVVALGERSAELAPLDPQRPKNAFDGRPVRFVTASAGLP